MLRDTGPMCARPWRERSPMNRLPVEPQVPAPLLVVWPGGSARRLPAGPDYLVGRDPRCDIVIPDARVSRYHAVLRLEDHRWVLVDNGSANGVFARGRRMGRIEIQGECQVRLAEPADAPVL